MYDAHVVGAGIAGLATACRLLAQRPSLRRAVVDNETRVAAHRSGHNSGVIHSGIYYRPGGAGLRTVLCSRPGELSDDFVIEEGPAVVNVFNAPPRRPLRPPWLSAKP